MANHLMSLARIFDLSNFEIVELEFVAVHCILIPEFYL